MPLRRKLITLCVTMVLACLGGLESQAARNNDRDRDRDRDRHRTLTVMTRNMYLGTDFSPIFAAPPDQFVFVAASVYSKVHASRVSERVAEIAEEIEADEPVLVGLQEVALWRLGPFNPFLQEPTASTVDYDFLQLLLNELNARGLHYAAVATVTNMDAEAPAVFGPTLAMNIRYTDRDVVLARTDLKNSEFKLESTEAGNFNASLTIPTGSLGPLTIRRGWVSVDAKFRGKRYRFVNTHLEEKAGLAVQVQLAQVAELLGGPGNTRRPVIFAGDFNSNAESNDPAQNATYVVLRSAGFRDAWNDTHRHQDVFTWPLFGVDLLPFLTPNERLDLILSRGRIDAEDAEIVGEDPSTDLTPSGLLPSDHAGVVVSLELKDD